MATDQALPNDEDLRLEALSALQLERLQPTFERVAAIAKTITQANNAMVGLMRADQLWRAGVALDDQQVVSREGTMTDVLLRTREALWLEDARADPRFADSPYVAGEPHIRFYAGAPILLCDGLCLGALYVYDSRPRPLDPEALARLIDLADLVAHECDAERTRRDLADAEAEARMAQALMASFVHSAPMAIAMTDRALNILQASPRFLVEMGLGERDIIGRSIYDLFPASGRFADAFNRALAGETVRGDRIRLNLPDGTEPWVRSETTPWRDVSGDVGGLLLATCEITDVVEALEETKRSEQRLKLALEIGQLSMWEMDYRRKQLTGENSDQVVQSEGTNYERLEANIWFGVHPADQPAAKALWREHVKFGTPFRTEYRVLQANGPHIWVQSASEAIKDEDGKVERVVGIMRDIDKVKRSEVALTKAKEAAETANRAKSEFLANMSHEIRTPLNGVMGVASALGRTRLSPDQREMVGLIETSAQTLESLLSDVLDLARIESGRLALKNEPFDLAQSVADVAALFEASAQAKGLDLICDVDDGARGAFLGDAARIRQILSNLVSNAVKFTARGEVALMARAEDGPDGARLILRVCDTGIGFDGDAAERLFERFEQADGSITRRYGGTGLGLAISRSLAVAMGGSLEAVSSPGEGSVFTLDVCLARVEMEIAAPSPAREDEDAAELDLSRFRVLLAEDHPTNRRVVELILGAAGVQLTCVEDGAEAVEAWAAQEFDLILMDMQMPVMDGLTAIRTIRRREAREGRSPTMIYALTANAMPEHAQASREAGAEGHLTKPITAEALFEAVEAAATHVTATAGDTALSA